MNISIGELLLFAEMCFSDDQKPVSLAVGGQRDDRVDRETLTGPF